QPIQVMSLEEGAGMPADAVFVVDAGDDVLPGATRRYPLLATETLVAAGVPGVTAVAALEDARNLAAALLAQNRVLHLSYAEIDERGAERTPTSLFGSDIQWTEDSEDSHDATQAVDTLLSWPDSDPVPAVSDVEALKITGGVKIFKDFVEAPF